MSLFLIVFCLYGGIFSTTLASQTDIVFADTITRHDVAHRTGGTDIKLSSYDGKILVNTVFGTGHATTTDSPGLIGEINNPIACNYDYTENYLYLTDMNGGGLIRKLAVTDKFASPFNRRFDVKTVWAGE